MDLIGKYKHKLRNEVMNIISYDPNTEMYKDDGGCYRTYQDIMNEYDRIYEENIYANGNNSILTGLIDKKPTEECITAIEEVKEVKETLITNNDPYESLIQSSILISKSLNEKSQINSNISLEFDFDIEKLFKITNLQQIEKEKVIKEIIKEIDIEKIKTAITNEIKNYEFK